jgi:hypothetical protein
MKKDRTDYALWGVIAGALFLAFGAAVLTSRAWTPEARLRLPVDAVNVGFWSVVLGWVFHAVAVLFGVRLSRRADRGAMADYDDQPPPPTD